MKFRHVGAFALAATSAAIAPALATAEAPEPTCHGKAATYVGTTGDDVISDETEDLGRNPVIILGEGSDTLEVGLSYESVDRLTVCAGPGDDSVEVYDGIGGRSQVLLDGGTDDDFVGFNGDSRYSYLASMTLIGSDGDDELRGANDADRMVGGRGDDLAYGLGGPDGIDGGEGNDVLHGERGSDRLRGGGGSDRLIGDLLSYPGGDDLANGGASYDRCNAERERDCER